MTQCSATAELVDANMQIIPGIILTCELEAGHHLAMSCDDPACPQAGIYLAHGHAGSSHAFTFRWSDPTLAELAEVLDPDEDFDLEVDIAPEVALEQQQNAAIDNGVPMLGSERDYQRIPEANPRCSVCGREVVRDWLYSTAWRHLEREDERGHFARVDAEPAPDPRRCSTCGREVMPLGPNGRHGWVHRNALDVARGDYHEADPAGIDPLVDEHVD